MLSKRTGRHTLALPNSHQKYAENSILHVYQLPDYQHSGKQLIAREVNYAAIDMNIWIANAKLRQSNSLLMPQTNVNYRGIARIIL